mmetsp:Transcript_8572/g.11315  ORF Transcript_8572/g.11315 Transcript_8572/m.11315 type:complete len:201 (+) Transcript_8572:1352-1954(+)
MRKKPTKCMKNLLLRWTIRWRLWQWKKKRRIRVWVILKRPLVWQMKLPLTNTFTGGMTSIVRGSHGTSTVSKQDTTGISTTRRTMTMIILPQRQSRDTNSISFTQTSLIRPKPRSLFWSLQRTTSLLLFDLLQALHMKTSPSKLSTVLGNIKGKEDLNVYLKEEYFLYLSISRDISIADNKEEGRQILQTYLKLFSMHSK